MSRKRAQAALAVLLFAPIFILLLGWHSVVWLHYYTFSQPLLESNLKLHFSAYVKPLVRAVGNRDSVSGARQAGQRAATFAQSTATVPQHLDALPWRPMNEISTDSLSRDSRVPIFGVSAFWIQG
jgi:hypothetical protein